MVPCQAWRDLIQATARVGRPRLRRNWVFAPDDKNVSSVARLIRPYMIANGEAARQIVSTPTA